MNTHSNMIERITQGLRSPFVLLFILALILRLIGVWLIASDVGSDALGSYLVDTKNYVEAAEAIRTDFNFQTMGVTIFGPGYPVFLALVGLLLLPHPLALSIIQALFGALAVVLMIHFALTLTNDRKISILSGLMLAIMPRAINLSSRLYSETPFVFLLLAGLILYVNGIKSQKPKYFMFSAIIITAAAFVRPVGQYMFLVLIISAIIYAIPHKAKSFMSVMRQMKWPVMVSLILIILTGLWVIRNNSLYGFRYLGFSGPTGLLKISALIRADIEGTTYEQAIEKSVAELKVSGNYDKEYYRTYADYADSLFKRLLRGNPWISFAVIIKNIYRNTHIVWGWPYTLLTFLGLLVMLSHRAYRPAVVVLILYLYFAFFAGFTVCQGKRIFFPGQIMAIIPISYLVLEVFYKCQKLYFKIRR